MADCRPDHLLEDDSVSDVLRQLIEVAYDTLIAHRADDHLRVRLPEAIRAADLPVTTVYRHLRRVHPGARPQETFERLVARHIHNIASGNADRPAVVDGVVDTLIGDSGAGDTETPQDRGRLLVRLIREAAATNADEYAGDELQRLARWAGNFEPTETKDRYLRYLRFVDIYTRVAERFGLKLRDELEWDHFAAATASLAEGLLGNHEAGLEEVYTNSLLALVYTWFEPADATPRTELPPAQEVFGAMTDRTGEVARR